MLETSASLPLRIRRYSAIRFTAALLERHASRDFRNQTGEPIAPSRDASGDLIQRAFVIEFETAAQGVGQHFLGETPDEFVALLRRQDGGKLARTFELFPTHQFTTGVDGEIPVLLPPGADAVEILEAKADRIHPRMTRGAGWILPVLHHSLAQRADEF